MLTPDPLHSDDKPPPGLRWNRAERKWQAGLWKEGGRLLLHGYYVGLFDDEAAVAWAYDKAAKWLWVNCILNFPPDGSLNPDRNLETSGPARAAAAAAAARTGAAHCPIGSGCCEGWSPFLRAPSPRPPPPSPCRWGCWAGHPTPAGPRRRPRGDAAVVRGAQVRGVEDGLGRCQKRGGGGGRHGRAQPTPLRCGCWRWAVGRPRRSCVGSWQAWTCRRTGTMRSRLGWCGGSWAWAARLREKRRHSREKEWKWRSGTNDARQ